MTMMMDPSSKPQTGCDTAITFTLVLNCSSRKSTKTATLLLPSAPACALDIKQQIESDFSIPVCVQTLTYHSSVLHDAEKFDPAHLRNGDTFEVAYPVESDYKDVELAVDWVRSWVELLQNKSTMSSGEFNRQKHHLFLNGVFRSNNAENLSIDLFLPWDDEKKYVNKVHFDSIGGLDSLITLYSLIAKQEWDNMGLQLRHMECVCLQSLVNFCQTFPLRRRVMALDGMSPCMRSLLRKQLERGSSIVEGNDRMYLEHLMRMATYVLFNICELPECQLPLAKNFQALNQILSISLSPTYGCKTSICVAGLMVCLAQCSEAHPYLAQYDIVDGLLAACSWRASLLPGDDTSSDEHQAVKMLQCYTALALAGIVISSPELLPTVLLPQIHSLMEKLLSTTSPSEVSQYEEKTGLVWCTFLPYLIFLYSPSCVESSGPDISNSTTMISQLQLCSINVLLHTLESAARRVAHRDILLREGLTDYIVCLPWQVPAGAQENARAVVKELGRHTQLHPPRLCNMARGQVAKMHCGLEKVLSESIAEIAYKLYHAQI